jgi:hypothetical protein
MEVWTFTFSECVENHKGMQIIGKTVDQGFTVKDLEEIYKKVKNRFVFDLSLIDLSDDCEHKDAPEASILIIHGGSRPSRALLTEIDDLKKQCRHQSLYVRQGC